MCKEMFFMVEMLGHGTTNEQLFFCLQLMKMYF